MRIIKLGDIDIQFCCPHCRTVWEINTKELNKNECGYYYVECPLCDERIVLKDNHELIKFLKKRKELENL